MDDWASLGKIVAISGDQPLHAGNLKKALDSMTVANIPMLAEQLCAAATPTVDDQRLQILDRVFAFARRAVENGQRHNIYGGLARIAGKLASSGLFVPNASVFLRLIMERYATCPEEAGQAETAFDAILAGVSPKDKSLADESAMTLSCQMPRLKKEHREKVIRAVKALPKGFLKESLPPSLEDYHRIVTKAEDMMDVPDLIPEEHWSMVSVHSHKGGVGKTTIALLLALELASDDNRVCLVDCDDEGPSLIQSVPHSTTENAEASFLSDWICSDDTELPVGLDRDCPLESMEGKLSCIFSSPIATDLARLDEFQRGKSPPRGDYSYLQHRVTRLIRELICVHDFDCVVLDTAPGLAHFSLDVLMSTLNVGGSQVFVMRPRMGDVAQFCIDTDWLGHLYDRKDQLERTAAVVNFTRVAEDGTEAMDVLDPEVVAAALGEWPGFGLLMERFFASGSSEKTLQRHVAASLGLFKEHAGRLSEMEVLRHVDALDRPRKKSQAETILADPTLRKLGRKILSRIGWQPKDRLPRGTA